MKTVYFENARSRIISVNTNTLYLFSFTGNTLSLQEEPVELEFVFNKQGISAEVLVLYSLGDGKSLNLNTAVTHHAPDTRCMIKVRGAVYDGGASKYKGKIVIDPIAQRTESYLSDRVLLLGNSIKNYSEPILEIRADDVKASHEASSGSVDKGQIYYLMSRGLSQKEAGETVTTGFFEEALAEIKDSGLAGNLRTKLVKLG